MRKGEAVKKLGVATDGKEHLGKEADPYPEALLKWILEGLNDLVDFHLWQDLKRKL